MKTGIYYLMTILLFVFFLVLHSAIICGQENKILSPVLIDTDAAIDDLRAVSMFLAVNELNILAITTSDGILSPEEGGIKVNQMLCSFERNNIPVAVGRRVEKDYPRHREKCKKVPWGDCSNNMIKTAPDAHVLLTDNIKQSDVPVVLVCLGPLTNIYDAISMSPEIKKNIKKIIWYNRFLDYTSGFNYQRDEHAAEFIINSDLEIIILSNLDKQNACLDLEFLKLVEEVNTRYAQTIASAHRTPFFFEKLKNGCLPVYDDLLIVYYLYAELFNIKFDVRNPSVHYNVEYQLAVVKEKIINILSGNYVINKNIVFERFPLNPDLYRSDIKENMNEIVEKHGTLEWEFCVLTNEIHGHLGIYSIIGAKMGLMAMETLNANRDELKVKSYAGNVPPLGCINDGLQVSTGATFGHGTISLVNDTVLIPSVIFIHENDTITIRLKEKYREQIQKDINDGIVKYGMLTDGYWKLIRSLGIQYWKEWSRNEIFEVTR